MRILIFDTETTGKYTWGMKPWDPAQPHLVQLGVLLQDGNGVTLDMFKTLVKPDGFTIPRDATDAHGISHERAMREGIRLDTALMTFHGMCQNIDVIVGHNVNFDINVMTSEFLRRQHYVPKWIKPTNRFDTMRAMTPICKLPNPKGYGAKFPKLHEAYEFAFGKKLEGAHDAFVDVKATAALYHWIQDYNRR